MADDSKEINLTYETLFELLRREKNRAEIQPLEPSFYKDFIGYLKTKKQLLQEKQSQLSQGDEVAKLSLQIENINKLMKELYERREKKVVSLAILNTKSGPELSKEGMLEFENKLYNDLIVLFSKYRKGILLNLLNQNLPKIEDEEPPKATKDVLNKPIQETKEALLVRFLSPIPKFVGEELETYGPFERDQISTLPAKIAKILIDRKKAEEINEE
ncbi:DNA replication complex GINS family protein [Candidatus Woesearchaeota archaeon]|nr:DNA replication complex GINS family protein [Candidatus Woesearchaeota archaeon]